LGRNLAALELQIIIGSIMRRYDIVLEDPDFEVREGSYCLLSFGMHDAWFMYDPDESLSGG